MRRATLRTSTLLDVPADHGPSWPQFWRARKQDTPKPRKSTLQGIRTPEGTSAALPTFNISLGGVAHYSSPPNANEALVIIPLNGSGLEIA